MSKAQTLRVAFPFEIRQVDANIVEIAVGPSGRAIPEVELLDAKAVGHSWGFSDATMRKIYNELDARALDLFVQHSITIERK